MTWWQVLLAVAGGVLLLWLSLILVLWLSSRDRVRLGDALRLLPDLLRLVAALIKDDRVSRGVRWTLVALGVYLALPFDLVPDFIPVLGYADDAIATALVLRFTMRAAGVEVITENWSGTPQGLRAVLRLAGIRST